MAKRTRQELSNQLSSRIDDEQTTFVDFMRKIRRDFKDNPQPFYIGFAAAAIIIGGIIYGLIQLNHYTTKRQEAIEPAFLYFHSGVSVETNWYQKIQIIKAAQGEMNNFQKDYPNNPWTIYFELMNGVALKESVMPGDPQADQTIAEALMIFDRFEKEKKDSKIGSIFVPRAAINVGHCYADRGELETAIQKYNQVIHDYPSSDVVAEAYFNIALCQERLNMYNDAMLTYQKVITDYSDSGWEAEARRRIAPLYYIFGKPVEADEQAGIPQINFQ